MINQAVNNNYIAFNHPGTQTWYARISTDNTSSFVIRNDYAGGTNVLTLAETGAATFSSSVTLSASNGNLDVGGEGFIRGNGSIYKTHEFTTGAANVAIYHQRNASGTIINKFDANGTSYITGGNVGIGTTSPGGILEARAGTGANFRVRNNGSNVLLIQNYNDTDAYRGLQIAASTIQLLTSSDGGTGASEAMRITSGGYTKASNDGTYISSTGAYHEMRSNAADSALVVSNTSASGSGYYSELVTSGTSQWHLLGYAGGAYKVYIYSNGNIQNANNSYGAISDIKLKENITFATPKLADLLKVKIRNYNLIGEETKQIGVIAQELEEVFPLMIEETEDFEKIEITDENGNINTEIKYLGTTTKSVKYSVFVPMLIKAIQEQTEIINQLTERITQLENK
jgi:hypothetical protein